MSARTGPWPAEPSDALRALALAGPRTVPLPEVEGPLTLLPLSGSWPWRLHLTASI